MPMILGPQGREIEIISGGPFFVIGHRINPSGNPRLAADIAGGAMALLTEEARRQIDAGAQAIDVNVGMSGDPPAGMRQAVRLLQEKFTAPLVLDSALPGVLLAGLEAAEGRVLVNSISAAADSLKALLPAVKARNVPFIGLTIDERGLPAGAKERVALAGRIVEKALACGIPLTDIMIDPVLLPFRFNPDAAGETLRAVSEIKSKYGVLTCLGLSNISFGSLPRAGMNAEFAALARRSGLDAGMLDPLDAETLAAVRAPEAAGAGSGDLERFRRKYAVNG